VARVYLGLGSNLGDREANLARALARLRSVMSIEAVSWVYETEPVGYREQPDFLNLVVVGQTELTPEALLEATQGIERELGRERPFRNAPRTIDIDLLLYDGLVRESPELTLPHPRMLERQFVLRPLADVDPELRHPVTGERIADRLAGEGTGERVEARFPGERLLGGSEEGGRGPEAPGGGPANQDAER
jgi:2-amino-4-hydroxy-6-hydroxymethyldihydropteridine diphosphokinase